MIQNLPFQILKRLPEFRSCVSYCQWRIINKRFISTEECKLDENLVTKCHKLLHYISTKGLESLDDRYISVSKGKKRAEGDTAQHFQDSCEMKVKAGNGGDGLISFLRLLCNPTAGPDGGDGGNGGHIMFKAKPNRKGLGHVYPFVNAANGGPGRGDDCAGKNAPDTIIEVPLGTIVKRDGEVVAELLNESDVFLAARGGAGGKGNSFFATSVNQSPKYAQFGGEGESANFELELRVMADVGLIGYPNAGKSTLLRAASRSRPRVASYPFTTLVPHVGVVSYADLHQVTIADIPGLMEGSHTNLGLGMAFLKHVMRCSSFLFVVDGSESNPLDQLRVLRDELECYGTGLSKRPHVVVFNKMDLQTTQENFEKLQREVDFPIIPISAKMGHNMKTLLAIVRLLADGDNPS